jgi:Zn finger protein HypA/HybF involved in hydrogenase expression
VIERFIEPFWARYARTITVEQRKALQAILQCRTPALGGHRYACDCGQTHHAFHSCNHRLCPQCGAADTAQWVDKQLGKLLPVPYFMVTFTLPEQLRPVMLGNRTAMELFFKCSSQALSCLLSDPKRTGFERHGFFGVYQSWTQDMRFHPHIHYIVPAVGLTADDRLRHLKNPKFLLHAEPIAQRLRTLLANALHDTGLIDTRLFWQLVKMDWNASVDPAGSGENAVKYLGQYVQRSVISDNRVLAIEGDQVSIRIKNRDTQAYEPRTMSGVEFIRRYLLHALPARFHRIRYRGYLHARGKPALQWLQVLLDARILKRSDSVQPVTTGYTCPRCGGAMQKVQRMPRAPPSRRNEHFFNRVAA